MSINLYSRVAVRNMSSIWKTYAISFCETTQRYPTSLYPNRRVNYVSIPQRLLLSNRFRVFPIWGSQNILPYKIFAGWAFSLFSKIKWSRLWWWHLIEKKINSRRDVPQHLTPITILDICNVPEMGQTNRNISGICNQCSSYRNVTLWVFDF